MYKWHISIIFTVRLPKSPMRLICISLEVLFTNYVGILHGHVDRSIVDDLDSNWRVTKLRNCFSDSEFCICNILIVSNLFQIRNWQADFSFVKIFIFIWKMMRMDYVAAYVIVHLQETFMTFYGYKTINCRINSDANMTWKWFEWYRVWPNKKGSEGSCLCVKLTLYRLKRWILTKFRILKI